MSDRGVAPSPTSGGFTHPMLFYRGLGDFLSGVGSFVRRALAADEPVLIAVPGERVDAICDSLGPAAAKVVCEDMTRLGRNPGRVLATLQSFADAHPGRPVRIVDETLWDGRTAQEVREAIRHEALVNLAFRDRPGTVLCPYDLSGLPDSVIAQAKRTHPSVIESGFHGRCDGYTDPAVVCADCDIPLPEPVSSQAIPFTSGQLALVRDATRAWLRDTGDRHTTGISDDEIPGRDFLLAVSEAAANTIAHSNGSGTLRLWTDGSFLTAEVSDEGRLTDPLAGRSRPSPDRADGGRGLWIIHQLCDLVEIRARKTGTTLRMHMAVRSA